MDAKLNSENMRKGGKIYDRLNQITGQQWRFDMGYQTYADQKYPVRMPDNGRIEHKICFRLNDCMGATLDDITNKKTYVSGLNEKLKYLSLPANLKHSVTRLTGDECKAELLQPWEGVVGEQIKQSYVWDANEECNSPIIRLTHYLAFFVDSDDVSELLDAVNKFCDMLEAMPDKDRSALLDEKPFAKRSVEKSNVPDISATLNPGGQSHQPQHKKEPVPQIGFNIRAART